MTTENPLFDGMPPASPTPEPEVTPPVEPTPPAETPPAGEVPPVEPTTPEAPETTPTEPTPPAKTDDQLVKDRAYFQTEMQKAKEDLAALKAETAVPEVPAPTPAQVPPPEGVTPQAPMSLDEMNEMLRDNPALGYEMVMNKVTEHLTKTIQQQQNNLQANVESKEANRILREFCSKNQVTQEQLSNAHEEVKALDVKGSPAAITSMIVDRINYHNLLADGKAAVTAAQAKATQAVKTAALTAQPNGGGVATLPAGEKSIESQIADKFGGKKATPKKLFAD